MSGCGGNCECKTVNEEEAVNVSVDAAPKRSVEFRVSKNPKKIIAEQPDGWHACLKQRTRCVIRVLEGTDYHTGLIITKEFEATNSCHVDDAEVCPRVAAGAKSGEGYDLCGPPNHAETEAAKLLLEHYPDGAPTGATAYLYGHTWLCMDCQHALTDAGVKNFIVTGEPA